MLGHFPTINKKQEFLKRRKIGFHRERNLLCGRLSQMCRLNCVSDCRFNVACRRRIHKTPIQKESQSQETSHGGRETPRSRNRSGTCPRALYPGIIHAFFCTCRKHHRRGGGSGTDPTSAWRDREVWMQSEPGLPRIILDVYPRLRGEEGANDRDSFTRSSDRPLTRKGDNRTWLR